MLGRRNSLAKERRSDMKSPDFSWCMLGLDLVPQIWKKNMVLSSYAPTRYRPMWVFLGGIKIYVCNNNNIVKDKMIVKMRGPSFLFVIFQNNGCGFSPHRKDTIYFLMMSCFPEKQSGILSTPYGGGKTDSTVFHLLDCLLHLCIHNLCGCPCDCQNIQMDFS